MRTATKLALVALATNLSGCVDGLDLGGKSDVQLCVEAHMAAYGAEKVVSEAAAAVTVEEMAEHMRDLDPEIPQELAQARGQAIKNARGRLLREEYGLIPRGVGVEQWDAQANTARKAEYYLICLRASAGQ